MDRPRKVLVLSLMALLALGSLCLPNSINAASVKSTGTIEVLLNKEQTIITGEKYEYNIELTNLDACDKELSTNFSCIPTIAVIIKQLDIETKEIVDSETLDHMNFGVHDLNILYDDVTIVSLNVLNIAVLDYKARIEVAYKSNVAETNILEIAARDSINATKSESYMVELKISNNSDSIIETELVIDEMASAPIVVIDNQELRRDEVLSLTLQPGERTISMTFVPLIEGHHWLSIRIESVHKRIPVLVHSQSSSSSNILYVSKTSLTEIMKDDRIVFDIKMDSAYLLGFSFLLLVFGGVLGFIRSGGSPPPIV
ncbi:MAG: hypothetical protein JW825_00190 [Candidatus Methanofastidiosa archaeon]|nr:hypothetical protein [Candidatus Methanofastidiosa archaeon]